MRLTASLFEVKENETGLYRENDNDLAYFVNDWFIHNFFKERFPEFVDKDGEFNGVEFQVSKEMLTQLLKLMCNKFNQERLDLSIKPKEHHINPDNIDELKQTIQFINDNPTAMVYYEGDY